MWMMERLSGLVLCCRACDSCSFPPMLDWSFTPSTLLSHSHFILFQHLKVGRQTWGEVICIVSMIRSYITRKIKLSIFSTGNIFIEKQKKKKRLHVFFRPSNQRTTLIINAEKMDFGTAVWFTTRAMIASFQCHTWEVTTQTPHSTAISMWTESHTRQWWSVMLCKYGGEPFCSQMGGKSVDFIRLMSVSVWSGF